VILQQNYRPLSPFISLYLLLSTRQAELAKIEFNPLIFKNNDEKNKKGQEAWQEEIKEIDLQIREHQTVINQLRERKQKLIAAHRKKRKPAWDSETPLYHYLAEHSDLGDALAIHRAVYRAMKGI
jgi:hypothetical protein